MDRMRYLTDVVCHARVHVAAGWLANFHREAPRDGQQPFEFYMEQAVDLIDGLELEGRALFPARGGADGVSASM